MALDLQFSELSLYQSFRVAHLLVALVALQLFRWLYSRWTHISISYLPGPIKTDWFFGNLPDLNFAEVGIFHVGWQKEHGYSFKIHGLAGVSIDQSCILLRELTRLQDQYLMTSDPKAVQHIYANSDVFVRQTQNREMFNMISGPGVATVIGADHKRQRRVMQPAFGVSQIKALFPVFARHAENVRV